MKILLIIFFVFPFILLSQSKEIDSLKTALLRSKEDTSKAVILVHLSEICDEKDILNYAKPGLFLSEKLKFKKGMAGCLNNIGYANHAIGNNQEALSYWNRSLKIFQELYDKASIAEVLNNIGFVYERQGLTEKGLDYYLKALKIREQLDDKSALANSLNNLALLYHNHGEIANSLQLNLKNIKVNEELKDEIALAQTFNNIALNYDALGDKKAGLSYLFKALNLRLKNKDSIGISESYINIGSMYGENKQYDSTIYFATKSYYIKKNLNDKFGMANAAISLGMTYFKIKNYKLSEEFANISLVLSQELSFPENIKNASKLLSQIYNEQGKYKEAYDMMVVFKQMSDSVNNVSIRNSMVKKQMQYDFDKKDEIAQKDQEKKDELAEEEKRIQRVIIYSVTAVLCLLLFLCVFIYRGYKQKQKANEMITLQKEEVEKQKEVVEHKNEIIEEKQKEILDSINYAKRIQYSLLAHDDFLDVNLSQSEAGAGGRYFVYFNPKDIVSGDFYWATKKTAISRGGGNDKDLFYLAVCDSTGHGIPGAFMSLLNIGFLSEAINEKGIEKPNEVFNYVRQRLTDSISKEGQKDGFDGILVCFESLAPVTLSGVEGQESREVKITYAAANNAPVLVNNGLLQKLDADKMPVGVGERKEDFKLFTIDVKEGDVLYLYTDGYADQFGGPKGKKFKYKPLNELILESYTKSMQEQKQILETTFGNWRGDLEQVDDVLVIGIKI